MAKPSDCPVRPYVVLRRNFSDMPFPPAMSDEQKRLCIGRVYGALESGGIPFSFFPSNERTDETRRLFEALNLFDSAEFLRLRHAAVMLIADGEQLVLVNDGESVTVIARGTDLAQAGQKAEDLERIVFAGFQRAQDEAGRYLTVHPRHLGTGAQYCRIAHLPCLASMNRIEKLSEAVEERFGCRLQAHTRADQPSDLYELFNIATRMENAMADVDNAADYAETAEAALRSELLSGESALPDWVFRSVGLFRFARRLTEKEFFKTWSMIHLGSAAGLLPVRCDQSAQLYHLAGQGASAEENQARADRVRAFLMEEMYVDTWKI